MTIIKTTGLAALAATSLLLTACGGSEKGEATAAAGQPMAAEEKIVDLASGETVATTPAEAAPIASVKGSVPGTGAELLRVQRSGKVVTATIRLTTDVLNALWWPELEGDEGTDESAEGLRLIDEINGREHYPLQSPDGECLCSSDIGAFHDDETSDVYAKFPAPPEGVDKVSLHVPGFPSFDAIPLSE